MIFSWRWLLVAFALALGCERNFAAGSTKEERAYAAAVGAFQDGMWSRAETEFAQFIQKFPKSPHMSDAVLLEAQATFYQGKLPSTIALLGARKAGAGNLADQYAYWIGEAQFQNGDFSEAAETFVSLTRDFPNSLLRLRAVVEAASARVRLGEWRQVVALLEEPGGVFRRAAELDSVNELVARGRLLLAQAKFAQADFGGAAAILQSLAAQPLKLELDWQRAYLLCQVKIAAGDLPAALVVTTNLLQIAGLEKDGVLNAEGVALRAGVLEKLGRTDEAIAAYRENLTNAPDGRQRQAVLKVAELAIGQKQFSSAEEALGKFLGQFPGSASADIALLTLGELHLKDYAALSGAEPAVNHLPQATAAFTQLLGTFTNSPFAGGAHLDRGWSLWLAGKTNESLDDFQAAVQKLPPSEDQAVARLKLGDALFAQKDFAGALTNYRAVLADFHNFPAVGESLGGRALYQSLRADLELQDMAAAGAAMAQILKLYPGGELGPSSALLYGEGLVDAGQPAAARAWFQQFEKQSPGSILRPQVELAVARTYERERDWPAAIGKYEGWRKEFPTNTLQPQADYALAQANFQAGHETNAFAQFTNFVAQFPTDDLAPPAQWWVADYYFRLPDYVNAERNYKFVFQNTNWQNSPLVYPARMMAGRAAVARQDYAGAIRDYFTRLEEDTNCPVELRVQAAFAHGAALMSADSTDTNNPLANFSGATNVFSPLCQFTNRWGALAWGELGDCYLQLASYDAATNAYAQACRAEDADISLRSRAQVGLGIALEKKAAAAAAGDQAGLFQQALDNYSDVLYQANLRDGETADDFWVKKAGLQAVDLFGTLGERPLVLPDLKISTVLSLFQRLEESLPQAKEPLEKKKAAVLAHLPPEKNLPAAE